MHKLLRFVYYWFPPLMWMTIIYYMSSQPRITMTQSSHWDFFIFKSLHMIEYGLLFFLLYRAFRSLKVIANAWVVVSAIGISALYAASDELHQLSIPTRTGRLRDVFIDILGMLVVYAMIKSIRILQKLL